MSERRYDLIPEKAGEDYHAGKPRLFWISWYVATREEPERYSAAVRERIREQFEAIDQDPEQCQQLEAILDAADQAADICRDEPAGVQ